jgi:hypothetical protein
MGLRVPEVVLVNQLQLAVIPPDYFQVILFEDHASQLAPGQAPQGSGPVQDDALLAIVRSHMPASPPAVAITHGRWSPPQDAGAASAADSRFSQSRTLQP